MIDMWINFGDGFLLVFAINDKISFDALPKKRERIIKGKHGEIVPMLLVGNKQDLSDKREVQYDDAKKLAESWGIDYIETSAKNKFKCKEALQALAKKIADAKIPVNKYCLCCNIY